MGWLYISAVFYPPLSKSQIGVKFFCTYLFLTDHPAQRPLVSSIWSLIEWFHLFLQLQRIPLYIYPNFFIDLFSCSQTLGCLCTFHRVFITMINIGIEHFGDTIPINCSTFQFLIASAQEAPSDLHQVSPDTWTGISACGLLRGSNS